MELCSFVKQTLPSYTQHELYYTWRMMNYRCFSDVHTSFSTYGGAGITVCERWRWDNPNGMINFVADVGPRPEKYTLDRQDPYGNYEPSNCRWADKKTQQNNFRKERDTESGYLGVVKASNGKWCAQISFDGVPFNINFFDNIEDAIAAREEAVRLRLEIGDENTLAELKKNIKTLENGKRPYNGKSSKHFGVSWSKSKNKWRTMLWRRNADGKLVSVCTGTYNCEEQAHQAVLAYLEKEKESKVEP